MKREDIYNGITEIDDDLIDGAAAKTKRRITARFWVPAVSAALAVCVGLTALRPWGGPVNDPPAYSPVPGGAVRTLAAAVYSEQAPYADYFEDKKAHEAWAEQNVERWGSLADYHGELDGFFSRVMGQFLTGEKGKNKVVSPLNLYMALAMLAETTDGESRGQIMDLLGAEDMESLRTQAGAVWKGTYRNDGATATVLANSLWLREDMEYVQSAVDTLAGDYHASSFQGAMGSEAMDRALRDWIGEQTGGLLKEQSQGLFLAPETVLALVSTVYFKDRWDQTFIEENTEPAVFHAPGGDVERDFLHQTILDGTVYRGSRFTAVRKWFQSNEGWMWFILPEEGTAPEELLEDEEVARLLSWTWSWREEHGQDAKVVLSVPKFDVSSDLELSEGLQALGITDVFDSARADFSPMLGEGGEASVSQVDHAVRVTVDKEGCTGAAYTAMLLMGYMPPREEMEVVFTLDRPFLFAVQNSANLTLFAGVVNEP